MKVRECHTKISIEFSHSGFVGSRARLWCVIGEIVRKEFFENVEVSLPLNFFGVSAHDGFCGFGQADAAHLGNLLEMVD